jgi:hypothetical protein
MECLCHSSFVIVVLIPPMPTFALPKETSMAPQISGVPHSLLSGCSEIYFLNTCFQGKEVNPEIINASASTGLRIVWSKFLA